MYLDEGERGVRFPDKRKEVSNMAAKKKVAAKKSPRKYVVHRRLEEPVNNLVGYVVLFVLALVVLFLVMKLKA